MDITDLLLVAVVAIVCGTIGQLTSSYSRGGWFAYLAFGFLGAMAGVVAARALNAPVIYNLRVRAVEFPVFYSIIGSVLFVAALGLLVKPGGRR